MSGIITITDISQGTMDGYKDISQAADHLGITVTILKGILQEEGVHVAGTKIIAILNLVKSRRGGNRKNKI